MKVNSIEHKQNEDRIITIINQEESEIFERLIVKQYNGIIILFFISSFCLHFGKADDTPLLRCQGFAVVYYGFTLDALDLEPPRLLLN